MQIALFLLSTALAFICAALSFVSLSGNSKNATMQADLLVKQTEIQELNQVVSLQNEEFQRQTQIINSGANVAQKLGPPILRDMGYLAAKNKNDKLKLLLAGQKWESFIPSEEELKKIEEARAKQGKAGGDASPSPAPASSPNPAFKP